jgi:hypothetical protein
VLIIVRFPKHDHVARCQSCGDESFDFKHAPGWKWAFACTGCGRIKHTTQGTPTYEDGNLIVELTKTEGAKR